HFHSHEEELVVILEGELVLITNRGEQVVRAGMCVGFRALTPDAHHLVNRSGQPARYLEIGSRVEADVAFYPDDDLCLVPDGPSDVFAAHMDGTPYSQD
ncbi:MAG: cupin domain-containing protein, partial [Myxococcota bacterium]